MPELPEVETIRLDLLQRLPRLKITGIEVIDNRILRTRPVSRFAARVRNKTIESVTRRGKLLIIGFTEGGYLLIHLKMTGQLIYGDRQTVKETKLILSLSNGQFLNYNDQRLFGRLGFVSEYQEDSFLMKIGPEPLSGDFNATWLAQALKPRRSPIKTMLMDQHFVAGIGNIYASEILFAAGIHPKKPGQELSQSEIKALHRSTIRVLKEAIRFRGTSMRNYRDSNGQKGSFINRIKVYNKENMPCPVCQRQIMRIIQAGRSTFYCQHCQPAHAQTAKYL